MMFRLTMAPQSASCASPSLSSGPQPLTPSGPQLPFGRGGPCRLGCPVIRAPQMVRVTAGCLPPPGGWAVAWVCTGLCVISSLERFKCQIKKNSSSQPELAAVASSCSLNGLVWNWLGQKHKQKRSVHPIPFPAVELRAFSLDFCMMWELNTCCLC